MSKTPQAMRVWWVCGGWEWSKTCVMTLTSVRGSARLHASTTTMCIWRAVAQTACAPLAIHPSFEPVPSPRTLDACTHIDTRTRTVTKDDVRCYLL